jgi:hypothetical protein
MGVSSSGLASGVQMSNAPQFAAVKAPKYVHGVVGKRHANELTKNAVREHVLRGGRWN